MNFTTHLRKMRFKNGVPISYWLSTNTGDVLMNDLIGKEITLEFFGQKWIEFRQISSFFGPVFWLKCAKK